MLYYRFSKERVCKYLFCVDYLETVKCNSKKGSYTQTLVQATKTFICPFSFVYVHMHVHDSRSLIHFRLFV